MVPAQKGLTLTVALYKVTGTPMNHEWRFGGFFYYFGEVCSGALT